jgi:tRNA-dihydrouridine synthase
MRIGPYTFNNKALILAPMAGVTDRPFRSFAGRVETAGEQLAVCRAFFNPITNNGLLAA